MPSSDNDEFASCTMAVKPAYSVCSAESKQIDVGYVRCGICVFLPVRLKIGDDRCVCVCVCVCTKYLSLTLKKGLGTSLVVLLELHIVELIVRKRKHEHEARNC